MVASIFDSVVFHVHVVAVVDCVVYVVPVLISAVDALVLIILLLFGYL